MLVTYLIASVDDAVEPLPDSKREDVVAVEEYPYEVVNEYGGATVTPVPPDSVARIPNCSIAVVEEAADAPIALMVFEAFC